MSGEEQQHATLSGRADLPRHLAHPFTPEGVTACHAIVATNTDDLMTWVYSCVSDDTSKTYCVYDAPSPEAIRRAAWRNRLPVDQIIEVQVLDP
jgi:hypothetical protein